MSNDWRELKSELAAWAEDDLVPGEAQGEMLNALTRINQLEDALKEALQKLSEARPAPTTGKVKTPEEIVEAYHITPVFMMDKVDGSDRPAILWYEAVRAIQQAERATYTAAASVLWAEERDQWQRDEQKLPGAQIVAQRMRVMRKVLEGRATQ